jgi:hypothetical protein
VKLCTILSFYSNFYRNAVKFMLVSSSHDVCGKGIMLKFAGLAITNNKFTS